MRRRGFTLVELLVVIAIIGVLVACLPPGQCEPRGEPPQKQCINNMKQWGLAMHMHEQSSGFLPVGSHQDPRRSLADHALALHRRSRSIQAISVGHGLLQRAESGVLRRASADVFLSE